MSDKTLEQLLEEQALLAEAIKAKQKEEQAAVIEEVVAKIKKYGITAKQLSSAFGFKTPNLEGKERKPAEPVYAYVIEGKEETWTGRGRTPLTLVKFLNGKNISLESFKNSDTYKIKKTEEA